MSRFSDLAPAPRFGGLAAWMHRDRQAPVARVVSVWPVRVRWAWAWAWLAVERSARERVCRLGGGGVAVGSDEGRNLAAVTRGPLSRSKSEAQNLVYSPAIAVSVGRALERRAALIKSQKCAMNGVVTL